MIYKVGGNGHFFMCPIMRLDAVHYKGMNEKKCSLQQQSRRLHVKEDNIFWVYAYL